MKLHWVLSKNSLGYACERSFPAYPMSSTTYHWITRKYSFRRTYRVKNNCVTTKWLRYICSKAIFEGSVGLTKNSLRYACEKSFPSYPISSRTNLWISRKYSSRRTYKAKNNFETIKLLRYMYSRDNFEASVSFDLKLTEICLLVILFWLSND